MTPFLHDPLSTVLFYLRNNLRALFKVFAVSYKKINVNGKACINLSDA
jgi:hypothetical protein